MKAFQVQFNEVLEREGIIQGSGNSKGANSWVKQALRGINRDPTSESDLREVFFLFDLDGDYEVNLAEVTEIIKLLGDNSADGALMCNGQACSPTAIRDMFVLAQRDRDLDGTITFDDFLEMWRKAGNEVKGKREGPVGAFKFFDW